MARTTTTLHLGYGEEKPAVTLHTYPSRSPIAAILLDGGALEICGNNPADLMLLADAFTDAARRLSDELDKAAAREINAEQVPA